MEYDNCKQSKMDLLNKILRQNTYNNSINKPRLTCSKNLWTDYTDENDDEEYLIYLGIRISLKPCKIEERSTCLKLGFLSNDKANDVDAFNKKNLYEFKESNPTESNRSPKKMYAIGNDIKDPERFEADTTSCEPLQKKGDIEDYTHLENKTNSYLNNYIGKSVAIHFFRTGTYSNNTKGVFSWDYSTKNSNLVSTEKMSAKINVYVQMTLNGKHGIYEIQNSKFLKSISQNTYDNLKLLKDKKIKDSRWGSMSFIPGVNQYHILIVEKETIFTIEEVFCDGDCIYPE